MKGASTIPINKAMTDVIVAYGMNGEPLRPQQGFPVRLIVPGFEGIFNTKWLRHIKAVDQYQLNMNDFGHLQRTAVNAAMIYQIGPKSVITFPSGGQKLPDHGWYEITGLAWSGQGAVRKVEISTDGGKSWHAAELKGISAAYGAHPPVRLYVELGWRRARDSFAHHRRDRPGPTDWRASRQDFGRALYPAVQTAYEQQHHYEVEDRQRRERDERARLGSYRFCKNKHRRLICANVRMNVPRQQILGLF